MIQSFKPSLAWIEAQQQAMLDRLLQWSAVNSGSFHLAGLQRMAHLAEQAFAILEPDSIQRLKTKPMLQVNAHGEEVSQSLGDVLEFKKRPNAPLQVLLCGHLDTVFAKDHHFQNTTFCDRNTLNGPGVADMKGGILVMLTALQALERCTMKSSIGWTVLLNSDEEIGSYGSRPLLENAAKQHHLGLVYEPSATPQGILAGERKGSGNFSIIVRGQSAHAGRAFDQGHNAVCAAAEVITQLDALNGQRDQVTINVAKLDGGSALNIVPDNAVIRFNVRTKQAGDQHWLVRQMNQMIQSLNQKSGVHAKLYGDFTRPPRPLAGQTKRLFEFVAETGDLLNLPVSWQATGGVCDGNNLCASGLPTVDTLGVRGGLIHSEQEYVLIDSLTERAKLSALLLFRLASGEYDGMFTT